MLSKELCELHKLTDYEDGDILTKEGALEGVVKGTKHPDLSVIKLLLFKLDKNMHCLPG